MSRLKSSKSKSKYSGVQMVRRKSGVRYAARLVVYLGTYRIEEEAAAAVQKFLGNKEREEKLLLIAEKKQNIIAGRVLKLTAWMCVTCAAGYSRKPLTCKHCGKSSFVRSRPESK